MGPTPKLSAIATILAWLTAALCAQVPPMFPAPRYPAGAGAWRAVVADFDSDGIPDIVTGNSAANTLTLLHGAGDASFYPPDTVGTVDRPRGIASGDVDEDGFADLLVANADADVVTVHRGHGNGTFDPGALVAVGNAPESLAVGDLNGDGHLDMVVGLSGESAMRELLGDGAGGFSPAAKQTAFSPRDIALADLNGDGRLDIAVVLSSSTDVGVLLGTGHGKFSPPVLYDAPDYPYAIAVGEVDGDGLPDLAIAVNGYNTGVQVRHGTGGGAFGLPTTYAGDSVADVALADVDGDSDLDLLAGRYSYTKSGLLVYTNDGAGNFALTGEFGIGPPPVGIVAADLDADEALDLVATSAAYTGDDILAIRGLGDGTFDESAALQSYGANGPVAVADFDVDGHLDLALGISYPVGLVQLRRGLGNGTFAAPVVAVASGTGVMRAPDLDGDAVPDLILALGDVKKLRVMHGNGDLTFTSIQDLSFNIKLNEALAADLSGDGVIDLALGQSTHSIDIYLGEGNGAFPPAPDQVIAIPSVDISRIVSGDINRDGLADLVVGDSQGTDFITILGVGEGAFGTPAIPPLTGVSAASVALGDLDADGALDLVVGRYQAFQPFGLSIFTGHGDGTFTLAQELLPGRLVTGVHIADMNADGKSDVVAALGTFEAIEKLIAVADGTGDGMLEQPRLYGLRDDPGQTALGDFDEDGRLDLAVAGDFFETSILVQRPAGTWSTVGHGLAGTAGMPKLTGTGMLTPGTQVSLVLTSSASLAPTWLVSGYVDLSLPFKGGTMVPTPMAILGPNMTNSVGVLVHSGLQHASLTSGLQFWFQEWIADVGGPAGFAATNGLRATVP